MAEITYRRMPLIGLTFTLALIAVLAIYASSQRERMVASAAAIEHEAIERGSELYIDDCANCHGAHGEGVNAAGPPLNVREFLAETSDQQLANIVADGRPGTSMPAWGQVNGGPYNDQITADLVAFIRAWEVTAPSRDDGVLMGDPLRGGSLFASTCFACHGIVGEGGPRGLPLNRPELLAKYDDDYYRETIARGRADKGMPTWGSVLSPGQVADLVAFIRSWETEPVGAGQGATGNVARGVRLYAEACATCHGLSGEGVQDLGMALRPNEVVAANDFDSLEATILSGSDHGEMPAQTGLLSDQDVADLVALLYRWQAEATHSPMDPARALASAQYLELCAECHGSAGEGGQSPDGTKGPPLANSENIQMTDMDTLSTLIARGNTKTGMPAFHRKLSPEEIAELLELIQSWQGE